MCTQFENKKKLVSVYIPTHNRLKLLKRSVCSVITQTYENIQLIVVNDGSTDGTREYLDSLVESEPQVKVIHNKKPKGACHARNLAIKSADGFFVTGLDDDDFFLPERIEEFVADWWEKENCFALFSSYSVIHNNTSISSYKRVRNPSLKKHFLRNGIGNQVFSTKENYIKSGLFDEELKVLQDFEFWYRFMSNGKVERVENYSYVFDHSHDSIRISKSKAKSILDSVEYIIKKHNLDRRSRVRFRIFSENYNYSGKLIKNLFFALITFDFRAVYLGLKVLMKKIIRPSN